MSNNKYANEEEHAALGGSFTPAPSGNHIATVIGIAIIGTIETEFKQVKSKKKMLRVYFELTNELNPEDENRPFVIGQDYANSLHKNANLRKDLEGGWGTMTDAQAETFNLVNLLGCNCMVNLAIETSAKGSQYNDVLGLAPIPAGFPIPAPKNEIFLFNLNPPFKQAEFERCEKFVQEKIKSSDEYQKLLSAPAPVQPAAAGFVPASNVPAGNKPF